jgi:hypothetical protein
VLGGLLGLFGLGHFQKAPAPPVAPPGKPPLPITGSCTTFVYDSVGRLTMTIDPPGPVFTYTYDATGWNTITE